jgi:hypothetical protein
MTQDLKRRLPMGDTESCLRQREHQSRLIRKAINEGRGQVEREIKKKVIGGGGQGTILRDNQFLWSNEPIIINQLSL